MWQRDKYLGHPLCRCRWLRAGLALLLMLLTSGPMMLAEAMAHSTGETAPVSHSTDSMAGVWEARLAQGSLRGTMHAADAARKLYVFTWWPDTNTILSGVQMSLVPATPQVEKALAALGRHQWVTIGGTRIPNPSHQPHIRVTAVVPEAPWQPQVPGPAPQPAPSSQEPPQEVASDGRLMALVHAVGEAAGDVLVIETADGIWPVTVPPMPELRQQVCSLNRGDIVSLAYAVKPWPAVPQHLQLNPNPADGMPAVQVIDSIRDWDGQQITLEGHLVLFPKSPAIVRNVYAIQVLGPEGLHRYVTLFNFQNQDKQSQIETMLSQAWAAPPEGSSPILDRYKYIHPDLWVRATGTYRHQAQNQANPTLEVEPENVTVMPKPAKVPRGTSPEG